MLCTFRWQPLNRFNPSPGKALPAGLSRQLAECDRPWIIDQPSRNRRVGTQSIINLLAPTNLTPALPGPEDECLAAKSCSQIRRMFCTDVRGYGRQTREGTIRLWVTLPHARKVCADAVGAPPVFSCPDNRIPMTLPCINGGSNIFLTSCLLHRPRDSIPPFDSRGSSSSSTPSRHSPFVEAIV